MEKDFDELQENFEEDNFSDEIEELDLD